MNAPKKRTRVKAQEEVVTALWAFAYAIGAPIAGGKKEGYVIPERREAVGDALDAIMEAFGYTVQELQ